MIDLKMRLRILSLPRALSEIAIKIDWRILCIVIFPVSKPCLYLNPYILKRFAFVGGKKNWLSKIWAFLTGFVSGFCGRWLWRGGIAACFAFWLQLYLHLFYIWAGFLQASSISFWYWSRIAFLITLDFWLRAFQNASHASTVCNFLQRLFNCLAFCWASLYFLVNFGLDLGVMLWNGVACEIAS